MKKFINIALITCLASSLFFVCINDLEIAKYYMILFLVIDRINERWFK